MENDDTVIMDFADIIMDFYITSNDITIVYYNPQIRAAVSISCYHYL